MWVLFDYFFLTEHMLVILLRRVFKKLTYSWAQEQVKPIYTRAPIHDQDLVTSYRVPEFLSRLELGE